MTPRATPPSSRHHQLAAAAADAIASQLHSWNPFLPNPTNSHKKPCLSNRTTSPSSLAGPTTTIDSSLSRLSLLDSTADISAPPPPPPSQSSSFHWLGPRKRRRRGGGSRSVSGRSSDRSGTHRLVAGGTDTSGGEMFDGSDVSEARGPKWSHVMDKESNVGFGNAGLASTAAAMMINEMQGNESGYGSEPGYRGDIELGYDDELDEEDEDVDGKQYMFWGDRVAGGGGGGGGDDFSAILFLIVMLIASYSLFVKFRSSWVVKFSLVY